LLEEERSGVFGSYWTRRVREEEEWGLLLVNCELLVVVVVLGGEEGFYLSKI